MATGLSFCLFGARNEKDSALNALATDVDLSNPSMTSGRLRINDGRSLIEKPTSPSILW
jgi:hypothetical protein